MLSLAATAPQRAAATRRAGRLQPPTAACSAAATARAPLRQPLLRARGPCVCAAVPSEEELQPQKEQAGTPEDDDKAGFNVPHTGRAAPMSEDKRAASEQQGAAPEGDRAIAGQAWQPMGESSETPEERYGSKEGAEQAMEESKDRSRRSELQTGDTESGRYAEGSA